MGGNVTIYSNKYHQDFKADNINTFEFGRDNLKLVISKIVDLVINSPVVSNDGDFKVSECVGGSSQHIFDEKIKDWEFYKYKDSMGDIDILVDEKYKKDVFDRLKTLEIIDCEPSFLEIKENGWKILYLGSNKITESNIGNQINCIFLVTSKDKTYHLQVDFNFKEFRNGKPTQWSKMSCSSSWVDVREKFKGVHHKFLLRALAGANSKLDNHIIATPSSTSSNITYSESVKNNNPRLLKFSVVHGLRMAYTKLNVTINGKDVYRELKTKESEFYTDPQMIYYHLFNCKIGDFRAYDMNNVFTSFVILCDIINDVVEDENVKKSIVDRFAKILWEYEGDIGQELYVNDPKRDEYEKLKAFTHLCLVLNIEDVYADCRTKYYSAYGRRQSKSNKG